MKKDKIILLGAGGMLGKALASAFRKHELHRYNRSQLDITNKLPVFETIKKIRPDFVINAAAYTEVDAGEKNRKTAFDVNGKAVGYIADACRKFGCVLVHISTDFVFDGKKKGYGENDKTNAINAYGKSKELGEKLLIKKLKKYYLIRTSWLFGNGENFVEAILRNAAKTNALKVVNDQYGSPTYAKDLAGQIKMIIETKKPYGIYHATNSGTCTWHQYAKTIIKLAKLKNKVIPITEKQLGRAAKRPKYSILANNKLPKMRHWKLALKDYMRER